MAESVGEQDQLRHMMMAASEAQLRTLFKPHAAPDELEYILRMRQAWLDGKRVIQAALCPEKDCGRKVHVIGDTDIDHCEHEQHAVTIYQLQQATTPAHWKVIVTGHGHSEGMVPD